MIENLLLMFSMEKKSTMLDYHTLPSNPSLAERFDIYSCNGFSLPSFAIRFLKERSSSYEAKADDIYVISYPKTGTTWTQEIVYLVQSDMNFDVATSETLSKRFPYIEHARTNFDLVKQMPSPRLLKTHLPYSLLPQDILDKKCKMIYITRNPKDVVVSYFHFACMLNETKYDGTFSQFLERFLQDRPTYSPFLQHTLEFWDHRDDDNILFLFYEDLQKDLPSAVKQIALFLGKSFTPSEINSIADHCSFGSMSRNEMVGLTKSDAREGNVGHFFRKGKVGDWKNYLTVSQSAQMDDWIKLKTEGTGISFIYE